MKIYLITSLLLFSAITQAQPVKPKIGSEKEVKDKFILIKKGLPDLKKNLTKWNGSDHTYKVKFEMGDRDVLFDENEDGHDQLLTIRYTTSYFSGTVADYQNYYKTLVATIKEVFGANYESSATDQEKNWSITFFMKGKDVSTSPVSIYVKCDWAVQQLGPGISIKVWSKVK